MNDLNPTLVQVTEKIVQRSAGLREAYLDRMRGAAELRARRRKSPRRYDLSCSNLAHGFAGCALDDKGDLKDSDKPNIGIVSAYNDMLSAHQPFETYPQQIKAAVRQAGGVAQFAGGVPAMCDGITQGQVGMELSLWSRDVIAMSTAIALSHEMFDGAVCLGVCDKIVPGLLIGALSFGHLPVVFLPAGPMPSGLPNAEKAKIREGYAAGEVSREELLEAESASYHSPGTCTFFGTANSNQMFMEIMGLHLPGASFVNPGTPLRDALTAAAARRATELTDLGGEYTPLCDVIDERAMVNAIAGLLATGGSTNHTIHLIAIARAAGILVTWRDFDELSAAVPLLARVYPNGTADVNEFQAAGGLAFVIGELLDAGLLHPDVRTVAGNGLEAYRSEARLEDGEVSWKRLDGGSRNRNVLRGPGEAFQSNGGLRRLHGNLGQAMIKTTAVKPEHRRVEAPAAVFDRQETVQAAFEAGELDRDVVVVLRFQGPQANGMPELHKLMPPLGVVQDRGYQVALVTDGRMSGASGKVSSAIHVTPEAAVGGPLARIEDGDLIVVDPDNGVLEARVDARDLDEREDVLADLAAYDEGVGRELFATFRANVTSADEGAIIFGLEEAWEEPEEEPAGDDDNVVLGW